MVKLFKCCKKKVPVAARGEENSVTESKDEDQFILFADAANDGNLKLMRKIASTIVDSKLKNDLLFYRDSNSNTPLHLAALNGNVKICEFLAQEMVSLDMIASIAIVNSMNKNGQSALTCVCLRGYLTKGNKSLATRDRHKIVKLLLQMNANPNIKHPRTSMTCLHWAAQNDDEKVVKILMEHKMDPFIFSEQERLPIDIAGSSLAVECIDEFLNCFAAHHGITESEQHSPIDLTDIHGVSQLNGANATSLSPDPPGFMAQRAVHSASKLDKSSFMISINQGSDMNYASRQVPGDKIGGMNLEIPEFQDNTRDSMLPSIQTKVPLVSEFYDLNVQMRDEEIKDSLEGGDGEVRESQRYASTGKEVVIPAPPSAQQFSQASGLDISSNENSHIDLMQKDLQSTPSEGEDEAFNEVPPEAGLPEFEKQKTKLIISLATMNLQTDCEVDMNMIDLEFIDKAHFEANPKAKALCRYLYWACYRNHMKLAKYLIIKEKINPFYKILDGKSPLMAAIEGSATTTLKMIIGYDYSYDSDERYMKEWKTYVDSFGNNALHLAMKTRNPNIIKILLDSGWGDLQSRNWMGKTPMQEPHNNPFSDKETLRIVIDHFKRVGFKEDMIQESDTEEIQAPTNYTDEEIIQKLAKKGISLFTEEANYCFVTNKKRQFVLLSQLDKLNDKYKHIAASKGLEMLPEEKLLKYKIFSMSANPEEKSLVLVYFSDTILNIKAEQIQLQVQLQGKYQTLPFDTTSKRFFQRFPASQQIFLIKKIFREQFHLENLSAGGIIFDHFMLHTTERKFFQKMQLKQTLYLAFTMLGDSWIDYFSFIQLIANYYGEKYAFYMTFLMHNIAWLILPAITGSGLFVYQVIQGLDLQEKDEYFINSFFKNSDDRNNFVYMFFIGIWSTCYMESWKRKQNTLRFMWGIEGREQEINNNQEIPQMNTEWTIGVQSGKKEKKILEAEPCYYQFRSLALVVFSVVFSFLVWWLPMKYLKSQKEFENPLYTELWDLFWTVCYALCMLGLNKAFLFVAQYIVKLENHKYLSDYEDSLVNKTAGLMLFNSFLGLFVAAFYDEKFDYVQKLLASLIIFKMVILNIINLIYNQLQKGSKFLKVSLRLRKHFRKFPGQYENDKEKDEHLDAEFQLHMSNQPTLLVEDYSTLVIQFGWLTLFSPCFAIGAVFQLFSCICQMVHHKDHMSNFRRRDNPVVGQNIGIWLDLLSTMSIVSFTVSIGLATVTSKRLEEIPKMYHQLTWGSTIILAFSIEHIMIVVKFMMDFAIPDTPEWVENQATFMRYRIKQIQGQICDLRLHWKLEKENPAQILEEVLAKEHSDTDLAGLLVKKIQKGCQLFLEEEEEQMARELMNSISDSEESESHDGSDLSEKNLVVDDDDTTNHNQASDMPEPRAKREKRVRLSQQDKERKLKKIYQNAW